MAYIPGTANSLADLLSAVQAACTANGWTLSGSVLSKGNCFTRLVVAGSDLQVTGGTGIDGSNALTTPGPQMARIGATTVPAALVFPVTYNIHVLANPDEVYVFVNFSVNRWQWLAFGCSPVPGLPGTGGWYGAQSSAGVQVGALVITPTTAGGYASGAGTSGALFGQNSSWTTGYCCNSYFHHGLDGLNWSAPSGFSDASVGVVDAWNPVVNLIGRQPNVFNGEIALLPIQVLVKRASAKVTLGGQIAHARYIRNDNLADGDLITLGGDRWKTYPWAQKNAAVRDGGTTNHTGTFGVAIRYDGP